MNRKSFARRCEAIETDFDGATYQWLGPFQPPEIRPSDGDLVHVVGALDRIDTIATTYYNDPRLWWVIAQANDLDEPVSALQLGLRLTIPDPQYVLGTLVR